MNPIMLAGLDVLVIAVVLYAIYYLRIVAKSIVVIRQGKNEMQQVLKEMTLAIGKAEETINGMKRLADDRGRFLQKQMDAANTLTEELKFISQAAEQVAQRLEKGTTSPETKPVAVAAAKSTATAGMSKAEKDLADALAKRKGEGR